MGRDGYFYVPSSLTGRIGVYSFSSAGLAKVDEINIGMPIDNLSVDANGDIFAAAFPDSLKLIKVATQGADLAVPGTVWKIRRVASERKENGKETRGDTGNYRVWKVLEDRDGKVIPRATTVAVHDAKTGRIFLGSVLGEHLTVCVPIPEEPTGGL